MQLTCYINQPEAIRRGHNANSTVKLEIDPAELTPAEREALAASFTSGEFRSAQHCYPLPEPTLQGLRETLQDLVAKAAAAEAAAAAAAAEKQAKTLSIQAEFDAGNPAEMVTISYLGNNEFGDRDRYNVLRDDQKEIAIAICDRLRSEREAQKALEAARIAANQEAHQAAKDQATEKIRQWTLANGSETLRLRAEEGFAWRSLAEQEWADAMLTQVGIAQPAVPTMDGFDDNSDACTSPTATEVKKLRVFREALKTIPEMAAEVELRTFTYTKELDKQHDGDPEKIVRTELKVTVNGPARGEVRYYLP